MKTRLTILCVLLVLCAAPNLLSQDHSPYRLGFHLRGLGGDFGMGIALDVATPSQWPIVRIGGTWNWQEVPDGPSFDFESYQTVRLGVASKSFAIHEQIRAYGEGGFMAVLASDNLSDNRVSPGGYGLFGFEFFTDDFGGSSLFLEVGGSSAGGRMDLAPGVQAFGTGIWVGAGLRLALTRSDK